MATSSDTEHGVTTRTFVDDDHVDHDTHLTEVIHDNPVEVTFWRRCRTCSVDYISTSSDIVDGPWRHDDTAPF